MDKIASPAELTAEIRKLLAYAESKEPSREKLAADLTALSNRVATAKEYIIWGVAPGTTHEDLLYTQAKSMGEAKRVCNVLEKEHGVTKCRVQVFDPTEAPDFTKVFAKKAGRESSNTEVWIKDTRHRLEVVVVGPDSRIIQSVESDLRTLAEESGSNIEEEIPHGVRTPGEWGYMGFTAEDAPQYLRDLRQLLKKEADHHSWVNAVHVGHNWPPGSDRFRREF